MPRRLIEWDSIEVRISGDRLAELARLFRVDPIEKLDLQFANGLLRVTGIVRKFVGVPFTVDIAEIVPEGMSVAVPVRSASAFGGIPIPRFLFGLVREQLRRGLVTYREPATFVVALDRFLPEFISADIREIWIIDGGLAVQLGSGGADVPPQFIGGKT